MSSLFLFEMIPKHEIIYCINVFQLIKVISAYNNRSARAK